MKNKELSGGGGVTRPLLPINDDYKDPILEDNNRLSKAAALFHGNEEALADVSDVILREIEREMCAECTKEEFIPLRHELAATRRVYYRFMAYCVEFNAREAKRKTEQKDKS